MYIALLGTCQQGSGPAALAIEDIEPFGDKSIEFEGSIGEDYPLSSVAGQIAFAATVTGGDGNYTWVWSIVEQFGDDQNINSGNIQVSDAGTTTGSGQPTYDDAIITANSAGQSDGDEVNALLNITCTVTDGTGASVATSQQMEVNAIYFT